VICATLVACTPDSLGFSDVPAISMESVTVLSDLEGNDSIIQVTIYYQDGDGDIGLTGADTSAPYDLGSPYSHNFPVTYLVENNRDSFVQLRKSNGDLYGNQHERISGRLQVNLPANPISLEPKIVKLEMKLIDRALNMSNTVTTEVIQLKH
jgi:hypothetical protein